MKPSDTHATRTTVASHDPDAFQRHFVTAPPACPANVRSITSAQLFAESPEVQILHGDTVYRLRRTALGKLILTK